MKLFSALLIPCFLLSQKQVKADAGFNCTFEQGFCGWIQSSTDQFDWTRNSGGTQSSDTGPSRDHTTGSGYYLYIETSSPRQPNDIARLVSPQLPPTNGSCLSFWYHMYGININRLSVFANAARIWSLTGGRGNAWNEVKVTIISNISFNITFEGLRGSGFHGDIAIDGVKMTTGVCVDRPLPLSCTFEQGLCLWSQSSADQFNWWRNRGSTPSSSTGPSGDHTTGNGHYIYIETSSPRQLNDTARLVSPQLPPTNGTCLSFWYHMYGDAVNRLSVFTNAVRAWTLVGDQGNSWYSKMLTIRSDVPFNITFEGISGSNERGEIALDDVNVTSGACVISLSCTFEQGLCLWSQSSADQFDWLFNRGSTLSSSTGPSGDHTTGTGYYLYIETSLPRQLNDTARLVSPQLPPTNGTCLSFWYHMYGDAVNRLSVYTNDVRAWTLVGDQGNSWNYKKFTIRSDVPFNITFEGIRGSDYTGDIALDDIIITSGACANIGFSTSSLSVTEDAGHVNVCMAKEGQIAIPLDVRLSTVNGSAKAPEDYTSLLGYSVSFAANETNKCVNVVIKDDNVTEYNEMFYIKMTINNSDVLFRENRKNLTVVITNDDQAIIGFSNTSPSVSEGAGHVTVCITKEGQTSIPLDVRLSTVDGSAKAPKDYTGLTGYNVAFAANETNKCVNVVIKEDNVTEYDEMFYIKMTTNNPALMLRENRKNVTVVIANDDQATIGFSTSSLSVSEGADNVNVCMAKEGETAIPLDVWLSTVDGSAKAPGDYTSLTGYNVAFAANETNKCVNVVIKDDNVTEYNEMFYIKMTTNNPAVILKENRKNVTVVITNDDQATIGLFTSSLSVSEDAGHMNVCMAKEGETAIPLDVRLSTVDGSAKALEDYTSLTGYNVAFAANETNKCVNVVIKDDNVTEYNEMFCIKMTTINSAVILKENRKNLTVLITNDDQVIVQFKERYIIVEENSKEGKIELICVTQGISAIPIHISFTVNSNNFSTTAEEDQDFSLRNKSLTFPPGVSSLSLIIDIKKDEKAESVEIMSIKMSILDENHLSEIGENDTAQVEITDKFDNEQAEKQKKEQEEKKDSDLRNIYILLTVSIVFTGLAIVCGIILFCFLMFSPKT